VKIDDARRASVYNGAPASDTRVLNASNFEPISSRAPDNSGGAARDEQPAITGGSNATRQ